MRISSAAREHCKTMELMVDRRWVSETARSRDSTRLPSNIRHLRWFG
jgi:hypothetical protein